jgi:hypothetical protein
MKWLHPIPSHHQRTSSATHMEAAAMKYLIALAIFIAFEHPALAQIESGTIVVWMATEHDFVLAADSRVTCGGVGCKSEDRDQYCKINALNGKLIFSVSGVGGDRRPGLQWDPAEIASRLARHRNLDTAQSIDALASDWLREVTPHLERSCQALKFDPRFPLDEHGEVAVFAGILANGTIHFSEAGILGKIDPQNLNARCTSQPNFISQSFNDPVNPRLIGDGGDLANAYLKDPKNFQEGKRMMAPIMTSTDWKDFATVTYQFAQLAIKLSGPNGSVGGPIDQIHMSAKGIEWLHRKPNCPTKFVPVPHTEAGLR